MTYRFQRGETISLALDAVEGNPALASAVTAELRSLSDTPMALPFAVAARAATADVPAGWTLTIDAATSATLAEGLYAADARIEIGGGVVITDPVRVRIRAR